MSFKALVFVTFAALVVSGAHGWCTGTAKYVVTNDCLWNSNTHPVDYPSTAMFSPLCGTSHNAEYTLFYEGGIATPGVKEVAETGACDTLRGEIDDCVLSGYCAADGYFQWECDTSANPPGVGNGVCTHSGTIDVSYEYPYVSMMSMIAPSPDWYVGVSNVNLCYQDQYSGEWYWLDQYPIDAPRDLYAWDAGTDGGATFLAPDYPLYPYQPITVFDREDTSNIFYNPVDYVLNPLCKLVLQKI